MTRRSSCRTRRRFQKRTKFLNFLLPLESPRRRPRRARVVVVVPLAFHPFLLTSYLLLTYLLTSYLLRVSKDDDVPKVMVFSLLGVMYFFQKKEDERFFVSLSLLKSLSFSLVVFFVVINNTLRAQSVRCHHHVAAAASRLTPPRYRSRFRDPFFGFYEREREHAYTQQNFKIPIFIFATFLPHHHNAWTPPTCATGRRGKKNTSLPPTRRYLPCSTPWTSRIAKQISTSDS